MIDIPRGCGFFLAPSEAVELRPAGVGRRKTHRSDLRGVRRALVVLALSPWFFLSLVVAASLGLFDSLQATSRNTVIQALTPDEMRGRVSSFQQMLTNGVPSLGQPACGSIPAPGCERKDQAAAQSRAVDTIAPPPLN